MMAVDTCVKNRGTSSSLDPAPSSLLLQGWKGFSQPSSKLSFLEGVWMPRKCQENERKREQRRAETGELKAPHQKFITEVIDVYKP